MRKILLAGVGLATLAAPAMAADMPVKAPILKAPPPAFSWNGWYLGVNAGGVWGNADFTWAANPAGFVPNPGEANAVSVAGTNTLKSSGFIGGGQIGYNYQLQNILFGLEGDIQYTGLSTSLTNGPIGSAILVPAITVLTQSYSSNWLSTVRGRIGIANGSWLLYGTAGAAIANVSFNDFVLYINSGTNETGAISQTRVGWTAGVGAEWAFSGNWSGKLEYLHVDLGSLTSTVFDTNGNPASFVTQTHKLTEDILRVGLNYRFGGPVVAKY
jgi:outer membrane immunogenic protein